MRDAVSKGEWGALPIKERLYDVSRGENRYVTLPLHKATFFLQFGNIMMTKEKHCKLFRIRRYQTFCIFFWAICLVNSISKT